MCGDLEDEEEGDSKLEEMLYARFVAHTRALLANAPSSPETPARSQGGPWLQATPIGSAGFRNAFRALARACQFLGGSPLQVAESGRYGAVGQQRVKVPDPSSRRSIDVTSP